MTTPEELNAPLGRDSEPTEPVQTIREQLLGRLTVLADKYPGIDPAELPDDDPEVAATLYKFDEWRRSYLQIGSSEERLTRQVTVTTMYFEAGFHNPEYLDEVANDWLVQDLDHAETAGFDALAMAIKHKIFEINKLIPDVENPTAMELGIKLEDLLDTDDCVELAFMEDVGEAVGAAFTLLLENGVEDPETTLREKGILEA